MHHQHATNRLPGPSVDEDDVRPPASNVRTIHNYPVQTSKTQLQGLLPFLSHLTSDIRHVKDSANMVVDVLSRATVCSLNLNSDRDHRLRARAV
ncbi:hypothetical protein ACTXT7_002056 [Hymenolepis weldensis]